MDSIDDNPFADLQSSFIAPKEADKENIEQGFKEVSLDDPSPSRPSQNQADDQQLRDDSAQDNSNDDNDDEDEGDKESLSDRKRSLSLQHQQQHQQQSQPVQQSQSIPATDVVKLPSGNLYETSVCDPQKIGNPANSYILYTIRTSVRKKYSSTLSEPLYRPRCQHTGRTH